MTYVDPEQPRQWRKAVRKTTRAIFVETPTNPLMRVVDLSPIAHVAREFGLALLVDATFASPINFRPLEHGADVVITSATKYLNGHSDVVAGAVAGSASFVEEVRRLLQVWGQAIDPHTAWLIDRGMRTLAVRMERHNANGLAVARWAETQPAFARVHYPGLPSHPDHVHARAVLAASAEWWASSSPAASRRRSARSSGSSSSPTRRAWPGSRAWSPSLGSPPTRTSGPTARGRSASPMDSSG